MLRNISHRQYPNTTTHSNKKYLNPRFFNLILIKNIYDIIFEATAKRGKHSTNKRNIRSTENKHFTKAPKTNIR